MGMNIVPPFILNLYEAKWSGSHTCGGWGGGGWGWGEEPSGKLWSGVCVDPRAGLDILEEEKNFAECS